MQFHVIPYHQRPQIPRISLRQSGQRRSAQPLSAFDFNSTSRQPLPKTCEHGSLSGVSALPSLKLVSSPYIKSKVSFFSLSLGKGEQGCIHRFPNISHMSYADHRALPCSLPVSLPGSEARWLASAAYDTDGREICKSSITFPRRLESWVLIIW